ncbi:MAG: MaoC family dehydratase [Alphaproteobacteria bacterium]
MVQFSKPVSDRYFEDYEPGVYEFDASVTVDEGEVIAFAKKYDPQPFHIDPVAAASGPFKGVIASGWHTAGMVMALLAEHYLSPVSAMASPGVDELRWPRPVRPGDTLRLRVSITDKRISRSKPDRGLVFSQVEGLNQHGDVVISFKAMNMTAVRPA